MRNFLIVLLIFITLLPLKTQAVAYRSACNQPASMQRKFFPRQGAKAQRLEAVDSSQPKVVSQRAVTSHQLPRVSQKEYAEIQSKLLAQHYLAHSTSNNTYLEFDPVNNLTAADNGTVSNAFIYDSMNRLVGSDVRCQRSEFGGQLSDRL